MTLPYEFSSSAGATRLKIVLSGGQGTCLTRAFAGVFFSWPTALRHEAGCIGSGRSAAMRTSRPYCRGERPHDVLEGQAEGFLRFVTQRRTNFGQRLTRRGQKFRSLQHAPPLQTGHRRQVASFLNCNVKTVRDATASSARLSTVHR